MAKSQEYLKLYEILDNSATTLENMDVPDVDKVMPLVNQGIDALKICMERIQQVRAQVEAIKI